MTDVDVLDIRVPAQFYKALAPFRAVAGPELEARLTQQMVVTLQAFLKDLARQVLLDTKLRRRTGRLAKMVTAGPRAFGFGSVNTIQGHFIVPDWVAIHEDGGDIHPRSARMLAVPMPDAMRADGTPKRRTPAEWKGMGTFTYTSSRTGKHYVVYKDAESQKLVFLYVLVDMVTLRAQLGVKTHYRLMLPMLLATWEFILAAELEAISASFLFSIIDDVV